MQTSTGKVAKLLLSRPVFAEPQLQNAAVVEPRTDVETWLRNLGLQQYAPTFHDHVVDGRLLAALTSDDLRDLGVSLVGHRRKLLEAIAELKCVAIPSGADRRQLTVLCWDLVGSTEINARLDPEDMRELLHSVLIAVAASVGRFKGYIATFTGDGAVIYFGYPQAQEDAAERAVRAGLNIVETVRKVGQERGTDLKVRVGIATSSVVAGELFREVGAQERSVVGEAPFLATRLQALAQPNTVVVGPETRRLLGLLFELNDLGPQMLKGFRVPMRAWSVLRESSLISRFEAAHAETMAPLIGRERELSLLSHRWRLACRGEAQVVLLSGEPGIGKSRLAQAFRKEMASQHQTIFYQCCPHHSHQPFHPAIGHLSLAAGFSPGDKPNTCLDKLEALVLQLQLDAAKIPYLATLLSLPNEGRYAAPDISPSVLKERTIDALIGLLRGLARTAAVLFVVEDVHWSDPTTLELITRAFRELQGSRILSLITFRPEFRPPWRDAQQGTSLQLSRLGQAEARALIESVTGGKALPDDVIKQIIVETDGVPLFIEEYTKTVIGSGSLHEQNGRYYVASGPLRVSIPATLQDSLMARLDRLGAAKEIAQIAAVIGREFRHDLIAAIAQDEELDEALHRLVASGLVFLRGTAPNVTYVFKHALVRDAAYANLLAGKRRQVHARIAQVLEEYFPGTLQAEPHVLAHHWTEAGVVEKAVVYRLKGGARALAHSGTVEAVAQLTMGLTLLEGLGDGDLRHRLELDLQIALGAALSASQGMAAAETAKAYRRAQELCGLTGEEERLMPVLLGLWACYNARDKLSAARAVAAQLLEVGERKGDAVIRILGHRALGATCFELGEFVSARTHLQRVLDLGASSARLLSAPLPYDPSVSGRAWLALTLSVLGYADQAVEQANKALLDAEQLQHQNTLALVLVLRCSLGQYLRDHDEVARHAKALLAVADRCAFVYWRGLARYFQGWAQARTGEITAGIDEMRLGLAACQATGARAYVPYNVALMADVCRLGNDALLGRKLLDQAMEQLRQTDARYCESELFCIDGELRLAGPEADRNGAEAAFQRSIEVARRQNAKMSELRAVTCLAKLWADSGERRRAHDLLVPICGWFTEGFKTHYVVEAKILMDGLALPAEQCRRHSKILFSATGG